MRGLRDGQMTVPQTPHPVVATSFESGPQRVCLALASYALSTGSRIAEGCSGS